MLEDKELDEYILNKNAQNTSDVNSADTSVPTVVENDTSNALVNTEINNVINQHVMQLFSDSVKEHSDDVKQLTDNAVKTELEIKNQEVEGRQKVKEAEIQEEVAKAKTKEDEAKHNRAQTVLKAQGLVKPIPAFFRRTAIFFGYPFFVIYLLTVGWILEMFTFVISGIITLVADCAERIAEVNKKFADNNEGRQFNVGKAILNLFKWLLIAGIAVTIVVLIVSK